MPEQSKPAEPLSNEQRASVLERYAEDIERHGRPLDSGLPYVLRDSAERIRKMSTASDNHGTKA